jgi:ABC-type polysaccharide/polyol phosphate transport system ATPase subunit
VTRHPDLAEDVLISIQEVSKRPPNPPPNPPRWMAKFLPGAKWSATQLDDGMNDDADEEDPDDDVDDDPEAVSRLSAIRGVSFDLRTGRALGLVGPDAGARRALLWMISGFVPPATGRILIRGHVAPLFNAAEINVTRQEGKQAIKLASTFFQWPWDLIQSRWGEIEEFARIHEITNWPEDSVEYEAHRTKRLLLSSLLHMDASVYLVAGNFYAIEPEFVARCHDLLEQRLAEGCAVIHSIGEAENLARFCHEAIYIDNGRPLFRGRVGEVARYAHERPKTIQPGSTRLPLRVHLVSESPFEVDDDGATLEIELDVVRRIELALGIRLVDEDGRQVRLESPDRFVAHKPGVFELVVRIPGGAIHRGRFRGMLVGTESDDPLDEADEAVELLTFDVVVTDGPDPLRAAGVERLVDEVDWSVREVSGATP